MSGSTEVRELQRESDIGSALVGWLSQPTAHRHAFERQRSGSHRFPIDAHA